MNSSAISWLAPSAADIAIERIQVTVSTPPDRELTFPCERPRPGQWAAAAQRLRQAGERLRRIPIAEIVSAIDRVASRWCDPSWPVRQAVRDRVAAVNGFSRAAVDRSFDLELRNYRADSLWRTLRRELGDPQVLDAPRPDAELPGATMAIGPDLVLAVFTGNVPGLPALSIVRSLLVKAPVVAKVASGEPTFAAAFAKSLYEERPELGEALLVTYWGREERDLLAELAREVDVVVAYGGRDAIRSLREALPATIKTIEHGHKLSFGYLSKAYVDRRGIAEIGRAVAADVAAFNQHACIAPQTYFVEGTIDEARTVAGAVASALARDAVTCPLGDLRTGDAAHLRLARVHAEWRTAASEARDVWHDDALEWTVVVDDALTLPDGMGNRFLRVVPVDGLESLLAQLRPLRAYLQNVGLGCTEDDLGEATRALAMLGASRVCEPGRMPEPSMMWKHDGMACVASLVRFCDVEMHAGSAGLARRGTT